MDRNIKIMSENVEDILPLTPMQKSMLFMLLLNPSGEFYFEQQRYRLTGCVRPELVEKAWNIVANNNEILRTVFRWKGLENPVQILLKEKKIPVKHFDLSQEKDCIKLSDNIELEEWRNKVDISTSPFRVAICKLSEEEYHMILSTHHIILDGWSNAILLKEFYEVYNCFHNGRGLIKKTKIKYKEYIRWMVKQDKSKAIDKWREYLKGYVPFKSVSPSNVTLQENYKTGIYPYRFNKDFIGELKSFTKKQGITLAALFYSIWGILQMQTYGVEDVVFGITVSGRDPEIIGIDDLVGMFIKTLPMRIRAEKGEKIINLVKQVSLDLVTIEGNQIVELSDILHYQGSPGENILNTAVVIQNYPLEKNYPAAMMVFSSLIWFHLDM
ncbi:condensation domain-containing protein [Alkaliphilus peptidifermentans]|uniref:condensation domain-containing protein n=1 Tax=Alkaliphilus peptidifermentans TaxID=426129 RepID=UPI0015A08953|nr:condensation domain-containing protein [Alkaliphilus peptidifermentans]